MTNKRLHKRAEEHDGLEAWRGELERTKADQAKALEQRRDEVAPSASPTAQGERAAFTCMCCNQVAKIRLDMRNAEVAKATKKVEAARSTVHEWRISTEEQKAVQADGLDVCPRRSTPSPPPTTTHTSLTMARVSLVSYYLHATGCRKAGGGSGAPARG